MKLTFLIFVFVALLAAFVQISETTPILEETKPGNLLNKLPGVNEVNQDCKSNGGSCNVAAECCSKRCHFYAHKCTI
ncbi:U-Asilidin(1)-Dg12-like [Cochliomyia hominivorax]